MKRKIGSILLALALVLSLIPASSFADSEEIWIPVNYSGDLSVEVKSNVEHTNDATWCTMDFWKAGKVNFEAKSRIDADLEKIIVYSAPSFDLFDTNKILEAEFAADESGIAQFPLDLKEGRVYVIFAEFDDGDEETNIVVNYTGDLAVKVKSGVPCENDTKYCQIIAREEGPISLDIESRIEDKHGKVEIYSAPSFDLFDTDKTLEGEFSVDESGKVQVTLNLKKDRVYVMWYVNSDSIFVSYRGILETTIKEGAFCEIDDVAKQIIGKKEEKIVFDVESNRVNYKLKSIKVYSGTFTDTLDGVKYDNLEQEITADKNGKVTITLNLDKTKAYILEEELIKDTTDLTTIKKELSKLKPSVTSAKVKTGIKLTAKTKGGSISKIKNTGAKVEYRFYRATKKTGKYTLKKTTTATTYTDTTVKKGKRYYYKVRVFVKDKDGTALGSTALSKSGIANRVFK